VLTFFKDCIRRALPVAIAVLSMPPAALAQSTSARVDHLSLQVVDQQKSADFYTSLFGLRDISLAKGRKGIPRWLIFADGFELHIQAGGVATAEKPFAHHFAVSVASLEAVIVKLESMKVAWSDGAGHSRKIATIRPDKTRQIYFQDPDGYWLEVNDHGQH
jgi:lactoylglutathione lyase